MLNVSHTAFECVRFEVLKALDGGFDFTGRLFPPPPP